MPNKDELPYEYHVAYYYIAKENFPGSATATVTHQGWACMNVHRSHPIDSGLHVPLVSDFIIANAKFSGREKAVKVVPINFILLKGPGLKYRVRMALKRMLSRLSRPNEE